MAAGQMLDAIARFSGMYGEEADASSAYTQAELGGPPTWILLARQAQKLTVVKICSICPEMSVPDLSFL